MKRIPSIDISCCIDCPYMHIDDEEEQDFCYHEDFPDDIDNLLTNDVNTQVHHDCPLPEAT